MQPNNEQPKQDESTPKRERAYLKALNSKQSNEKVGQVFITTTKMQPPAAAAPAEEKLSPLKEKTIVDIMREYGVDRQKALNILNQPM